MKAVIIFSGYNPRAVLAFVRTLDKLGINYGIIVKKSNDNIELTSYANRVVARRHKDELDLADMTQAIQEARSALQTEECVIAPSTESLNRFLLEHRDQFVALGCTIPLVPQTLYEQVSDKYSFGQLCEANGIAVPERYPSLQSAKIPFVAKPNTYVSNGGAVYNPVLITSQHELESFVSEYRTEDFYYQEFVEGVSYYLLYFFHADGTCSKTSQRNYMQQAKGKSMIAAVTSTYHVSEESKKYEDMFKLIGFTGLIMIEVKQSEHTAYMIEANPRFWGPSQLFVDQKTNLFECFLYEQGVIAQKPVFLESQEAYRYFWHGGLVQTEEAGEAVAYHDYDVKKFEEEKEDWIAADVYNRPDSRAVYKQEVELS